MNWIKQKLYKKIWIFYNLIIVLVLIFLFEIFGPENKKIIRVSSSTFGNFDATLGVKYEPNTSHSYSYLKKDGTVVECLNEISKTNKNGFRGLDTLDEYKSASQKIIVTGDSFSHWNNDGLTIVDITKNRVGGSVPGISMINISGGAFGLKHMFVSATNFIQNNEKFKPNTVLIQFIGDDITRDWWVLKSIKDNQNNIRARIAKTEKCLELDSFCGADEYIINEKATTNWCDNQKDSGNVDGVSLEIIKNYRSIIYNSFIFFGMESKLLNKILNWDSKTIDLLISFLTKYNLLKQKNKNTIPRITELNQIDFENMLSPIKKLQNDGIDIIMIYLPVKEEIKNQQISLNKFQEQILMNIEEYLDINIYRPISFKIYKSISEFSVSPYDNHPSQELQNAYSIYISNILINKINKLINTN